MKALAMLDHVMLWVARFYTAFLVVVSFICPFVIHFPVVPFGINVFGTIFLSWAVSSWNLNRDIARVYLGLSSIVEMGILGYFAEIDAMTGGGWNLRGDLIVGAMMGSLTPLIWAAIRPPHNPHIGRSVKSRLANAAKSELRFLLFPPFFKTPLPSFR